MISFFFALAVLILGYVFYGKAVDKVFGPDDRKCPAVAMEDGVDYLVLPTWKVFLVQLLNIAGLGPIYGAVAGAMWGPQVFLWICFGTIFAGGVHDYLSGMLSERNRGASISEVTGKYLGPQMKTIMRFFSVILLIFVGTVFMTGPAGLLFKLTPTKGFIGSQNFWLLIVLIYYILATMFPVDKIIGRIYPVFGVVLIIMALGIIGGIFTGIFNGVYHMPEITFANVHPDHKAIFPFMFITVACGAISGFHSTQSPLMARCFTPESNGRSIFYGAMVCEGVIALIWAAAACTFFPTPLALQEAYNSAGGAGTVVYSISTGTLGFAGGVLAMLGVIACPITSGDTAFRSARLTLADWFAMDQETVPQRLKFSIPIFIVGAALSQMNFGIIWRYFSWSNQTLAMIVLWAGAVYFYQYGKSTKAYLMAAIPATFMSVVTMNYILIAKEGFRLSNTIGFPVGIIFAIVCVVTFYLKVIKNPEMTQLNECPDMCA